MSGEALSPGERRRLAGRVVVATHNRGKLREIGELLSPFGLAALSAAELGLEEPEETGSTFRDNAVLKARAAARASGLVALADDSGLCVDALDGAPGVYSARWDKARDPSAGIPCFSAALISPKGKSCPSGRKIGS